MAFVTRFYVDRTHAGLEYTSYGNWNPTGSLLVLETFPEILVVAGTVSAVKTLAEPSSSRMTKILIELSL